MISAKNSIGGASRAARALAVAVLVSWSLLAGCGEAADNATATITTALTVPASSATASPTRPAEAGRTAAPAAGGAGDLDPSFGDGGMVVTDFGSGSDEARDVVIQPDGKIVVAGESFHFSESVQERRPRFTLARYHPDGTLDAGFGAGGKVVSKMTDEDGDSSSAHALALQPDGKIVVAGTAADSGAYKNIFAVARYNPDGTLDTGFGVDGRVLTPVASRAGFADADVAGAVAIYPDGKILVAGTTGDYGAHDFALVRYNADGTLDRGFGDDGIRLAGSGADDVGNALALQSDGKIVVAGSRSAADNDDFSIARFHADGTLDAAFGEGGFAIGEFVGGDDQAHAVAIRPDGKVVAAGYASLMSPELCKGDFYSAACEMYGFALAQYNADGSLDAGFGDGGKALADFGHTTSGSALALLPDGKLVIAGSVIQSDFGLAVYNADGNLDTSFGDSGLMRTNFAGEVDGGDRVYGLAVQADGKLVAVGIGATDALGIQSDFALARYER